MKKTFALIVFLLCSLTACGQAQKQEVETEKTPSEIVEAVITSQSNLPELIRVTALDAEFDTYLANYYLLDREQVADGALCYVDGVDASEIAVMALVDGGDTKTVEEALSAYIQNRAGDFAGYAPQQEALAKSGIVVTNGNYAALLICPDTAAAEAAFLDCFGEAAPLEERSPAAAPAAPTEILPAESKGTPEETALNLIDAAELESPDTTEANPPVTVSEVPANAVQTPVSGPKSAQESAAVETAAPVQQTETETPPDPNYNSAAVLRAWSSGDTSALGEVNLSVYNAAKEVIEQTISDGMNSYEKELAIHDYITGWSSFNMSAFSHAPGGEEEYDINTPLGVLVNRSGTCWGYSATFQLLMDLLGIECITVYGSPSGNGVEHTWNQVKLDGEWYCVDTAWDDPIGGSPGHRYFNLTSDEFRSSGIHCWDEAAVPEATGTAYRYGA